MVSAVRTDEEVELAYMKIYEREEMIREEGYGRGLTQGLTQGLVQGRSEGSMLHLLQMIIKKISKGKKYRDYHGRTGRRQRDDQQTVYACPGAS